MSLESSRIMPTPPTLSSFLQNIRDLPKSITLSGITAGFIVALISYTGPILIILQAAKAANFTPEQTASWIWAIVMGNGIGSILLSLLYRQPLITPHNTAGSALLVTSLVQFPLSDAIGAYIVVSIAIILVGLSGLFSRVMRLIPQPVILAVLAGVLLRFGLGIFNAIDDAPLNPLMIVAMVAAFFLLKRAKFRAPTLGAIGIGALIAAAAGQMQLAEVNLALTLPVFTAPTFSSNAILTLSLPLFALALSSQYAPGQAVLRANHYEPPINSILTITGVMSLILSFFGGHGTCLGAEFAVCPRPSRAARQSLRAAHQQYFDHHRRHVANLVIFRRSRHMPRRIDSCYCRWPRSTTRPAQAVCQRGCIGSMACRIRLVGRSCGQFIRGLPRCICLDHRRFSPQRHHRQFVGGCAGKTVWTRCGNCCFPMHGG